MHCNAVHAGETRRNKNLTSAATAGDAMRRGTLAPQSFNGRWLRLFLEAVDCHSYCPCQGRDRYQYDKRLIYCRFFRFCHCHPPRIDQAGGIFPLNMS